MHIILRFPLKSSKGLCNLHSKYLPWFKIATWNYHCQNGNRSPPPPSTNVSTVNYIATPVTVCIPYGMLCCSKDPPFITFNTFVGDKQLKKKYCHYQIAWLSSWRKKIGNTQVNQTWVNGRKHFDFCTGIGEQVRRLSDTWLPKWTNFSHSFVLCLSNSNNLVFCVDLQKLTQWLKQLLKQPKYKWIGLEGCSLWEFTVVYLKGTMKMHSDIE